MLRCGVLLHVAVRCGVYGVVLLYVVVCIVLWCVEGWRTCIHRQRQQAIKGLNDLGI